MILFGAGSSFPFDIPTMSEFVSKFLEQCNEKETEFYTEIKSIIQTSDDTIGYPLEFDLESLLAILNDLSSNEKRKPITIATASFLISQKMNIFKAKETYNEISENMLLKLKELIFNECIKPIRYGRKTKNMNFLDKFYGPLMYLLNQGEYVKTEKGKGIRDVFSTNWDFCFKEWANFVGNRIDEGMKQGSSGNLFLDVPNFKTQAMQRLENPRYPWQGAHQYIPLHGCIDYFYYDVFKRNGSYKEIRKHPDPISYYKDKDNLKNMFIIYPLEAVGYDETVKSPYLDMLYLFGESVRESDMFYIIGYSLRDPTISSIIEDRLEKKIDEANISILSDNLDKRMDQSNESRHKIMVFTRGAEKLKNDLKRKGQLLLSKTFIPIEVTFPKILDFNNENIINNKFDDEYSSSLRNVLESMHKIFPNAKWGEIVSEINKKYGLSI